MIIGRNLIEKMYSENYDDEYEDTRLYSTGDDELDDLLERAFCEGYEYAQKEFNSKASKKANNQYFNKLADSVPMDSTWGYFRSAFGNTKKNKLKDGRAIAKNLPEDPLERRQTLKKLGLSLGEMNENQWPKYLKGYIKHDRSEPKPVGNVVEKVVKSAKNKPYLSRL